MSLAERISRGAKATFGGNLVGMLSNAALIVLLTRVFLTPEEFGELNFVLSAVGVLAIFATLGLPKSTARYVTEFTEKDPEQVPHVVRRASSTSPRSSRWSASARSSSGGRSQSWSASRRWCRTCSSPRCTSP